MQKKMTLILNLLKDCYLCRNFKFDVLLVEKEFHCGSTKSTSSSQRTGGHSSTQIITYIYHFDFNSIHFICIILLTTDIHIFPKNIK